MYDHFCGPVGVAMCERLDIALYSASGYHFDEVHGHDLEHAISQHLRLVRADGTLHLWCRHRKGPLGGAAGCIILWRFYSLHLIIVYIYILYIHRCTSFSSSQATVKDVPYLVYKRGEQIGHQARQGSKLNFHLLKKMILQQTPGTQLPHQQAAWLSFPWEMAKLQPHDRCRTPFDHCRHNISEEAIESVL